MFFFLSKILATLIKPIFWIIISLLVAVITNKKSLKIRLTLISLSLLIFFSNPFIAYKFMEAWEPVTIKKNCLKQYDVGILLSGMCVYNKKDKRIEFKNGSDRILQCMDLYHSGKIKSIFISGGSGFISQPDFKEAQLLYDYMILNGIPKSAINFESTSRNTYENAIKSAQYLHPQTSNKSYLLISSAYHIPRAMLCFKKAGFDCDYYNTDKLSKHTDFILEDYFIPSTTALAYWDVLFKEWIGIITYKIRKYA